MPAAQKTTNSFLFPFILKDALIVKNLPKHPLSYANLCYLYGQRYFNLVVHTNECLIHYRKVSLVLEHTQQPHPTFM